MIASIGYCSAATLMGQAAIDYATDASYCDVAIKARIAGIRPCEKDLFRRLLFNCAINNTDDHLRNHAFIRDSTGWRLSPVFDVVVGRGRRLVLRPAPGVSPATDVETALSAAPAFSLTSRQAIDIWEEMRFGLADLPGLVSRYELKQRDQDIMTELAPTLAGFLT